MQTYTQLYSNITLHSEAQSHIEQIYSFKELWGMKISNTVTLLDKNQTNLFEKKKKNEFYKTLLIKKIKEVLQDSICEKEEKQFLWDFIGEKEEKWLLQEFVDKKKKGKEVRWDFI